MRRLRTVFVALVTWIYAANPVAAQQRPLDTHDPETVGAGSVRVESGITYTRRDFYPLSGLQGNLWQVPVISITVGLSPIADFQLSGGPYNRLAITDRRDAPLAGLVTAPGDVTHAVEDIVLSTQIRAVPEARGRPSFGFRFSTRLPNAKHESGLGQDTTDFSASLLTAKTIGASRLIGNTGITIMSEPLDPTKQNDVLTYGLSLSYRMNPHAAVVAEMNGRWSVRNGVPPIGTESRGTWKLGGRYTHASVQVDVAAIFGVTAIDPVAGVTAGVAYLFKAFTVQ